MSDPFESNCRYNQIACTCRDGGSKHKWRSHYELERIAEAHERSLTAPKINPEAMVLGPMVYGSRAWAACAADGGAVLECWRGGHSQSWRRAHPFQKHDLDELDGPWRVVRTWTNDDYPETVAAGTRERIAVMLRGHQKAAT